MRLPPIAWNPSLSALSKDFAEILRELPAVPTDKRKAKPANAQWIWFGHLSEGVAPPGW